MGQGMIHKLIDVLTKAAREMGADCDCLYIERTAVTVHRIMSYQSRQFHTLEHVFGFLDGADAQTTLAAVFHDLVYYQVDDGLPPEIESLFQGCVERSGPALALSARFAECDEAARACMAIFGFSPGTALSPFGGLNEFLSALAMARLFRDRLPLSEIVAAAACIELSIPFRAPAGAPAAALRDRLASLASSGAVALDAEEIARIVRRAVAFGNADVKDFALGDPAKFLSNTWKLLPESNASLRRKGVFSIKEYRIALQKMLGFFRSLNPAAVFHDFEGAPTAGEMEGLREAAARNLAFAQTYIKAKLLAVGFLEAIAEVSGGDAPMALFMGDLPAEGQSGEDIVSSLPPAPAPSWLDTSNPLYRLLKDGRLDESSFDLKNSPLALYLYHRLAPGAWRSQVEAAEGYFAGKVGVEAFISGFGEGFALEFGRACSRMVPTRRKLLEDWMASRAPAS